MQATALDSRRFRREALASVAHIFVLSGLAVAQPLFDLFSRQAEFFITHDARPIDLVLMALALSVLLPLALVLLSLPAALLGSTAWRWLHCALVGSLAGLFALQLIKRLAPSVETGPSIATAAALAVLSAVLYRRWSACRTFLTLLSPAALLFPLLFLFGSPIRELVLPSRVTLADGRSAGATPVVMVILDELSLSSLLDESGEVDPVRYPNLAALAGDAHWFRDATTASTDTTVSVPVIVSGRLPERDGLLPLAADHPDNLFTWLGAAGYRMNVFETVTRLCPQPLCSSMATVRGGFGQRFDALATDLVVVYLHLLLPDALAVRLPAIEDRWSHFTETTIGTRLARMLGYAAASVRAAGRTRRQDDVRWLFGRFLEGISGGDHRALHFIHLMLPHTPWRYLPSGREYGLTPFFPHGLPGKKWRDNDRWEVIQGFQRHLLQVGYADRLIGRLVARLEERDLYDSAAVVVVADHGATYRVRRGTRQVSKVTLGDVLNVPFLVKLPGQNRPVGHDGVVRTVDLMPTLADALGLVLPWPTDGRSALRPESPPRPGTVTYGTKSWDVATMHASRERSVARKLRLFGSEVRPGGLFRLGSRGDLVGREVADAPAAPASGRPGVTVELNEPWAFEDLDPSAALFPARLSGRVRFPRPRVDSMELAVAINGTIEAQTRTVRHDGDRARFTAMVPERALLAGRNVVEVFELAGDGALVPTRQVRAAAFALAGAPGNEAIRKPTGPPASLVPGRSGEARVESDGRRAWVDGRFAAEPGAWQPETLLVFAGGRCILARDGELSRKRAGVSGTVDTRFAIRLPDAFTTESPELRLFLLAAGTASEMTMR